MKVSLPLIQRTLQTSRIVGVTVVIASVLFGSLLVASGRLGANDALARSPIPPRAVVSRVPDPTTLRVAALGHHEAVADLMWLNALSFFGKYFGVRKDPSWLWPHLDAITTLDPNFSLVYEWAGTVVMYGGEITNETVLVSNEVLERGVDRFPLRWELWMMLGVNYARELRAPTPEQGRAWREQGAEAFARAAALPGAPWFLRVAALSTADREQDIALTSRMVDAARIAPQSDAEANSMMAFSTRRLPPLIRRRIEFRAAMAERMRERVRWAFNPAILALAVHPEPLYSGSESAPATDP